MGKKRLVELSVRLVRPPDATGVGIMCLRRRSVEAYYAFREMPCAIGGRGFAVHRVDPSELYYVRIGKPEECSCECMGFLRHGNCKHVQGILRLVQHEAI
jgi:hypothetical protein